MNTQHVSLDVTKRPAVTPVVYLGQGDKNGTAIQASIYDDGTALSLAGKAVRFCMQTPNGRGYYEVAGTVNESTAAFTIDETYAASVAGVTDVAYVEVLEGSTVVCSTNRFRVVVLPNATEGADPSGAYTNGDKEFLDEAGSQLRSMLNVSEAELEDAISDAQSDVADAVDDADAATKAAYAAIEAMGDISKLAVPKMSEFIRGGAKLGDGLTVDSNEKLNLGPLVKHSTGVTDGSALFGVQGEGYATQSGTPTPSNPQPIMVARGRNLLDYTTFVQGSISGQGVDINTDIRLRSPLVEVNPQATYAISVNGSVGSSQMLVFEVDEYNASKSWLRSISANATNYVYHPNSDARYVRILLRIGNNSVITVNDIVWFQLELGTAPTPYVPYGHVGLEVTVNGQTTVTPVPLPSKGFLGALPDGTKDTLAIDSAGGVECVNACGEFTLDGSSDETLEVCSSGMPFSLANLPQDIAEYSAGDSLPNIYGNMGIQATQSSNWHVLPNAFSRVKFDQSRLYFKGSGLPDTIKDLRTWLAAHPMKFLYPLATTTTEHGYIDLPALPEGATVTIPELDNVGVDYWVKGIPEVTEYGLAMLARLQSEIDEVEQAVADLSAAVANL